MSSCDAVATFSRAAVSDESKAFRICFLNLPSDSARFFASFFSSLGMLRSNSISSILLKTNWSITIFVNGAR